MLLNMAESGIIYVSHGLLKLHAKSTQAGSRDQLSLKLLFICIQDDSYIVLT